MSTSSKNGIGSSSDEKVRAIDLRFTKESLIAYLEDGRTIEVPLEWYPRLAHAPAKKLRNFQWIGRGLGITWPELDEDLSIEGFLKGARAPRSAAYMNFAWRNNISEQSEVAEVPKKVKQGKRPLATQSQLARTAKSPGK